MQRRSRRWTIGTFARLVAALLVPAMLAPGMALGAGPVRVADGEPGNDTQLSVFTGAEAAFMEKKSAMAAALGSFGATGAKSGATAIAYAPCEYDPCEGDPTWPSPSGPSVAKTLGTKARQQNNYYFCGPASGQVVINWTRGIVSGNNDGEDTTTNWRKQSKIATWMSTTTSGTGGANLAVGLNNPNGVLKPTADWVYAYDNNGTVQDLLHKIVVDIDAYGMPLVLATAPHMKDAGSNYLESWPKVVDGAHHWIVLRGYDATASATNPIIRYQDSSFGFGGSTGAFDDLLSVIWQVSAWNQGGHVVW